MVGNIRPVADVNEALAWLRQGSPQQVASTAAVETDAAVGPLSLASGAVESRIVWLERTPNRLELEVTVDREGLLVLSQAWYPGWVATLDGRPATLRRANGLLSAVVVPPGSHHVQLTYRPPLALAGGSISAAALLGLAVAGCLLWARRVAARRAGR